MKKHLIYLIILILSPICYSQQIKKDHIQEDLNQLISDLSNDYVYGRTKKVDLNCIKEYYSNQISKISNRNEVVLFFENLLNEFYDSHLILDTNTNFSYRLYSPIHAKLVNDKAYISNVWQSQISNLDINISGAEILKINDQSIQDQIKNFPTHCNDKTSIEVREWILNKVIAGKYNEPRKLTLKLIDKETVNLNLDTLNFHKTSELLSIKIQDEVGILRINNSLGNNNLIKLFDEALDSLKNTEGLIIDLRNTVDGGNTYVARGILGRFVSKEQPYQKHSLIEKYNNGPEIKRSWIEYVSPRMENYKQPVVILVGRWTGSMGEGLAVGFDAATDAYIFGSEMQRLAGEMYNYNFKNFNFGYRLSNARLSHIDGTPREEFIPEFYIEESNPQYDTVLKKGIEIIKQKDN